MGEDPNRPRICDLEVGSRDSSQKVMHPALKRPDVWKSQLVSHNWEIRCWRRLRLEHTLFFLPMPDTSKGSLSSRGKSVSNQMIQWSGLIHTPDLTVGIPRCRWRGRPQTFGERPTRAQHEKSMVDVATDPTTHKIDLEAIQRLGSDSWYKDKKNYQRGSPTQNMDSTTENGYGVRFDDDFGIVPNLTADILFWRKARYERLFSAHNHNHLVISNEQHDHEGSLSSMQADAPSRRIFLHIVVSSLNTTFPFCACTDRISRP